MADGRHGQEAASGRGVHARLAWMAVVAVAALCVVGVALRAASAKLGDADGILFGGTHCTFEAMSRQAAEPREPKWKKTQRLLGYVGEVVDVALVDNPARVVVADAIGRVTIWNRETGLQDVSLPRHEIALTAVVANHNGRRIAVATAARLTVWDTNTAEATREFSVYKADPGTVAMDRAGSLVAARIKPGVVTVWQAHSGKSLSFADTVGPVAALSLTSNSQIAIASTTGEAELWDIDRQRLVFKAPKHPGGIRSVHVSPDGAFLASGGADGVVNVWNVATGASVGQFQAGATITSVKVKNRGARVVVATGKGGVALRNAKTGRVIRGYGGKGLDARHIALSRDGRTLAAVLVGGDYGIWMPGTNREQPTPGNRRRVAGVALNHDGSLLVAEYARGGATLLDTETGRTVYEDMSPFTDGLILVDGVITRPPPGPLAVRPLRGGGLLVAGGSGICVRETPYAKEERRFEGRPDATYPYVLSPDETLLLTGSADGLAHIWEVAGGAHLRTLAGHSQRVLSASFDDGNTLLATGAMDGTVRLWDPLTGDDLGELPTRAPGAHAVSLSPDGQYLLAWRREQTGPDGVDVVAMSQLWDLRTRTEISPPAPEWIHGSAWATDPTRLHTVGRLEGRFAVKSWSPDDFTRRGSIGLDAAWVRPNRARRSVGRDVVTWPVAHPAALGRIVALASLRAAEARRRARARTQTDVPRIQLPVTRSDLPDGREMLPFDRMHGVRRIAVSRDGSTFAAITDDGSIDIWRRTDRQPAR